MVIRELQENEVIFKLVVEEESTPIEGNLCLDINQYSKQIKKIKKRLSEGDVWAWCRVSVRASWNGFGGESVLRLVSYDNEFAFRDSKSFQELKKEALNDLNSYLLVLFSRMSPIIKIYASPI